MGADQPAWSASKEFRLRPGTPVWQVFSLRCGWQLPIDYWQAPGGTGTKSFGS
jgi:hypothetical protein